VNVVTDRGEHVITPKELAQANADHYTMLIQWSVQDGVYVVSLPEWGDTIHTHGATYAEAAEMGAELLALLIATTRQRGEPLPSPVLFGSVPGQSAS
jgi:antitoxin HicB